jgi:hypothetical protein
MLTYTTRRTLVGQLSSDSSSANLTILDTLLNEADREICTMKPWGFRQKTRTASTVTSNSHPVAPDCGKLLNVSVTIGSTTYTPKRVKTMEEWDRLNQSTSTSNTPEYWFPFARIYSFYPAPSSATTDAITESYQAIQKDLSIADYTTGGVLTATNGSTAIVGTSTTWTASMAGRYIRITESDTANKGDGIWYQISSVTDATNLTLSTVYQGTSISAGNAAYTIGQTSLIPEEFQMVSIYKVLEHYFTYLQPDEKRAMQAKINYQEAMKRMNAECGSMSVL